MILPDAPKPTRENGFLKSFRTFWYFFRFLRPYKKEVALKLLFLFLLTPIGQIGVFLNKFLLDDVVLADQKPVDERLRLLWTVLGLQFGIWVVTRITVIIKEVVNLYLDLHITLDIQEAFYRKLQGLSLRSIRDRSIGENMYRTAEDMGNAYARTGLGSMVTEDWMAIFDTFYRGAVAAALIATIDKTIALAVFLYFVPWAILTHGFNTWYKQLDFDRRNIWQEFYAVARDVIAGLKNIKAYGRGRWAYHRLFGIVQYQRRFDFKRFWAGYWGTNGALRLLDIALAQGIFIYCGVGVLKGRYTIGEIGVITFLTMSFLGPFKDIMNMIQSFRFKLIPAERMLQTMRAETEIKELPGAPKLASLEGKVEFRGVRFGYEPGRLLFEGLDLRIQPGERVAFVGPSGAGKSTVMNLLLRLYDPLAGQVLVDGHDLKALNLKAYLRRTGVVLQDTFLFAGTIRENILYGDFLADEAKLARAIELADLRAYVESAPNGLDTFLGEGTKISGGQKQRLGIARALIRDPNLLIFDEPTAHLDVISEHHVFDTIRKVSAGRTTFIISHRLAPVLFVDRIAVVAAGGLEAIGSHADLLRTSPTYQALWREQAAA